MEVVFHPDAAKRFNDLAEKIRERIAIVSETRARHQTSYAPYTSAKVTPADVIGPITWVDHIVDGLGNEVGRVWVQQGQMVGLLDDAYEDLRKLAKQIEKTSALRNRVDSRFILDEMFRWLKAASEENGGEPLVAHLLTCCEKSIQDYEIWIPLFRVHGREEFVLGEVVFRNISPAIMERFFDAKGKPALPPGAKQTLERQRSQLQDHLAACVSVTAEKRTAQKLARAKAEEAIALLRFLSPANWVLGVQSYCLPLGRERTETPTELFVRAGEITEISKEVLERNPMFWDVDQERLRFPGLLDLLHALSNQRTTDFKQKLYDALLLYSRNSVASEVSDKLVFVVVSLESMLLRDSSEPITKNVGERMAFLIGASIEDRMAIIRNVDATHRIRSKFIYHGESVEDPQTIEQFLEYGWQCFHVLLQQIDVFETKAELIEALERRKLT